MKAARYVLFVATTLGIAVTLSGCFFWPGNSIN